MDAHRAAGGAGVPMAVYTSTQIWHPERIGALAIYCSDGRWGEAFDEFCHRHLNLPRYDRLALPGGPASLVRTELPLADAPTLKRQIAFLISAHQLQRIVLITHFGCACYTEQLGIDAGAAVEQQIDDVRQAAALLVEWFPEVRAEGYLAMRSGRTLSFHAL